MVNHHHRPRVDHFERQRAKLLRKFPFLFHRNHPEAPDDLDHHSPSDIELGLSDADPEEEGDGEEEEEEDEATTATTTTTTSSGDE